MTCLEAFLLHMDILGGQMSSNDNLLMRNGWLKNECGNWVKDSLVLSVYDKRYLQVKGDKRVLDKVKSAGMFIKKKNESLLVYNDALFVFLKDIYVEEE